MLTEKCVEADGYAATAAEVRKSKALEPARCMNISKEESSMTNETFMKEKPILGREFDS